MGLEITPEPDDRERAAILAALAEEDAEAPRDSPWAEALRPGRGDERQPDP
jgi:hypothetical protein